MVWVQSELAEELAVVSAWLSALLPWSASLAIGSISGGTLVEIRFPFGLIRYLFGIEISGNNQPENPLFLTPWNAAQFYGEAPGALSYNIWLGAAVVLAVAVLLSIALYAFEEWFEEAAVDPVRLMGGLLLLAAVLLTFSMLFLQFGAGPLGTASPFVGFVVPIGVLFQFAFAYTLLRVERVDSSDSGGQQTTDAA